MSLLDSFKRAPEKPDRGDTGKPNILIMLPIYLLQGGEEPFADAATNYNEPKLDVLSVYVTLYKIFCYNKSLLLKFGKDIYYSTILDKQRERIAAISLEFSETFALLMRMFHELDGLPKDVSHPDLEHLIGFTLIRKEKEFADIKDNEDEGVRWLAKIAPALEAARHTAEEYFESRWENSGFSKEELEEWLSKGWWGAKPTHQQQGTGMSPVSLDQLSAEAKSQMGKGMSLGELIEYRHKLTANIEFNLYGEGVKEEGRRARTIRNSTDEKIFGLTASDMVDGDSGGLENLKKGIAMENIAEKMKILEELSASSKQRGMNMKRAMANILTDADRLERFGPEHQEIMKTGATGSRFLATRRFGKILRDIQQEAQAVVAA